ncbi:DMT family transporter [Geitlerinema splendidum]|nr:DMT family transporter [Geitlerinema splendidum]
MIYLGELAALFAAFLWAASSVAFRYIGRSVSPLHLNFTKGAVAIALIGLTLTLQQDWTPGGNWRAIALLLASGALGIGIGDTFFLSAINTIGPRRTLILEALSPPLAATLAFVFLQEQLDWESLFGIFLTVAGVIWVVSEGMAQPLLQTSTPLRGIGFGLLSALGQAGGAVLSRAALSTTTISPLWSSLFRLLAGLAAIALILLFQQPQQNGFKPLYSPERSHSGKSLLGTIALTAFFSTFLGIWLQQTAFKYAKVGVAQSLLATSPLFAIPLARFSGERVSLRAILGAAIAIVGILLLFND